VPRRTLAEAALSDPLQGLPLAAPSPAGWAEAATRDIDALLADHAHCELKAASTALSLAGRFGEHSRLVEDLTALAHEELRHFQRVHDLLRERGKALPKVGPDRYVQMIKSSPPPRRPGTSALVDALIVCGFVEARSCERFRLLARLGSALPDPLPAFYAELSTAEARHHELFFGHALRAADPEVVRARIREFAAIEADIVRSLPAGPHIH
jgi:tRNA 2-(methylsulfanyl)-N6-isopentenyladenosine37 hydroxylase